MTVLMEFTKVGGSQETDLLVNIDHIVAIQKHPTEPAALLIHPRLGTAFSVYGNLRDVADRLSAIRK